MIYVFDEIRNKNSDEVIESFYPILSKDRLKKLFKYRNIIDRHLCCLSYLLLEYGIKKEYNIEFKSMDKIICNKYGKPGFLNLPNIFFNISHCIYGVSVIISNKKVGIDVQNIVPYDADVAAFILSNNEIKAIENTLNKDILFTRYWTLKECYIKFLGKAIDKSLKKVDFSNYSKNEFMLERNHYKIVYYDKFILSACGPKNALKIEKVKLNQLLESKFCKI